MSMNTDWNRIDDYLANRLAASERSEFEGDLRADPALAADLAFYLATKQTLRAEGQQARKAELLARTPRLTRRSSWPFAIAAAACVTLLLGIGWTLWLPKNTATELADAYIDKNLTQLSVTMGADADSLQQSIDLINKSQLTQADDLLTGLLKRQPINAEALKWAGVVSLRRGQYDKAINQFGQLGRRTDLYANPGLFLESLARIKRNRPDDKDRAKSLLQRVVNENLEGADEATQLLNNL
ncbi:MAG: hypothetical protein EAZ91_11045 [Cytophagales bacterium]|nr:MAG: hypothetical protein EAZ91_11045 [Cytophagales bacterium]